MDSVNELLDSYNDLIDAYAKLQEEHVTLLKEHEETLEKYKNLLIQDNANLKRIMQLESKELKEKLEDYNGQVDG